MDGVVVQFLGEIDNLQGVEGTLLDADTAGLTQTDFLGDADLVGAALVGFVLVVDVTALGDTLLARPVRGTEVRTLVVTAVWLAAVQVDDCDAVVGPRYAATVSSIVQDTNQSENVMKATYR